MSKASSIAMLQAPLPASSLVTTMVYNNQGNNQGTLGCSGGVLKAALESAISVTTMNKLPQLKYLFSFECLAAMPGMK